MSTTPPNERQDRRATNGAWSSTPSPRQGVFMPSPPPLYASSESTMWPHVGSVSVVGGQSPPPPLSNMAWSPTYTSAPYQVAQGTVAHEAIKSTVGKIVAVGPPLIQTVQAVPMQYTPVVQAQAAPIHFKDVQIVQVVKEVPVDRVVEVMVEKMVYNEVEVPVERIVTKEVLVEIERQVPVDRVVEVPVEKIVRVPVEKIVTVEVEKIVEKLVEVPVERLVFKEVPVPMEIPVVQTVEREVVREVPVEKIVWRDREVPVERLITKEVPYAVERIVEKFIEVPGRYCRKFFLFGDCVQSIRALIFSMHCTVERVVTKEVPVPYEVKANPEIIQVTKEVPVDRIVEVVVEKVVIKEVPVYIDKVVYQDVIVEVEKVVKTEVPVQVEVVRIVDREVLVEVIKEVPVDRLVEVTVEKIVEVPVPYEVVKEIPVERVVTKQDDEMVRRLQAEIKKLQGDLDQKENCIKLHNLHTRALDLDVVENDEEHADLAWRQVQDANTYQIQVSEFPAEDEPADIAKLRDKNFSDCYSGPGLRYTHKLKDDYVHVFRGRARNNESYTNWSYYVVIENRSEAEAYADGAC